MFGLAFSQAPFSAQGYASYLASVAESASADSVQSSSNSGNSATDALNAIVTQNRSLSAVVQVLELSDATSTTSMSVVTNAQGFEPNGLIINAVASISAFNSAFDLLHANATAQSVRDSSAIVDINELALSSTEQTTTVSAVGARIEALSGLTSQLATMAANRIQTEASNAVDTPSSTAVKSVNRTETSTATDTLQVNFAPVVARIESSTANTTQASSVVRGVLEVSVAQDRSGIVVSRVIQEQSNAAAVSGASVNATAARSEPSAAIDLTNRSVSLLHNSSVFELGDANSIQAAQMAASRSVIEQLNAVDANIVVNTRVADYQPVTSRPKIQAVDSFIKEGFAAKMTQQFRCPAIFVSSNDKLRNLQALLGNQQPAYPFLFLSIRSVSASSDAYMANRLARQGVPVSLNSDNNQIQLARLVPANFEIEVTYATNKYSGHDTDSVEGYIRRWLFARRIGSMNFNVDYGLTQLSISYTIADSAPVPVRENPVDVPEAIYVFNSTVVVHGFTSEPEMSTVGKINQIQLAQHPDNSGQFFAF